MTTNLILHNYPLSPFSEKIRCMLGYTQLPWSSVRTTAAPPRPFIDLLAGGYRRIPVAQIGADIYCDTRTITTQVARLSGRPELALENCDGEINAFVERVEPVIFMSCVASAFGIGILRTLWAESTVAELINAAKDRAGLNRSMRVKVAPPAKAGRVVSDFCKELEGRLEDTDFLFGAMPTVADFSAYHCLWFIREVGRKNLWRKRPRTLAWLDRMRAFGHGARSELDALAALDVAMTSEPAPLPANIDNPLLGRRVRIGPTDYGLNTSSGTLVAATEREWIIARETAKTGLLHVHFPRHGFEIRAR